VEQAMAERFSRAGRKMTANNLKQAQVFERGEVLPNANGTAPGFGWRRRARSWSCSPGPRTSCSPCSPSRSSHGLRKWGYCLIKKHICN
jgi:nicotinamide-nucleotide amidase